LPELPEVETVKKTLEAAVIGKRIVDVVITLPKLVLPLEVEDFKAKVKDSLITGIDRRGKYLLVCLSSGYTLVTSLRMTGRFVFVPANKKLEADKHTHLVFKFEDGSHLYFNDIRKFGTMHCIPQDCVDICPEIVKLGPEPFGPEFSPEWLIKNLKNKNRKIKPLLLDQTFIAGLGNIYADEALFQAGIHPETPAKDLDPKRIHALYQAIVTVLTEAVAKKGTTIRDYVDGEGQKGNYQSLLKVYGRKGKKCYNCEEEIKTVKLGGRTSHFCPQCQREEG
jgi:formamidopyrimidine-DNA glycosylase